MSSEARVQTHNVVLSFAAGPPAVQTNDIQINVAFPVKRIVFHPPKHNIAFGAATTDQYLLSSSLNKGMGIVGFVDGMVTGVQTEAITVVFEDLMQFNGYHKFVLRSFAEASGQAATPITAMIWQCIEFYSS